MREFGREVEFKRWLRAKFFGSSFSVEAGIGSTVGLPDLILKSPEQKAPWFLELKPGALEGDVLHFKKIRPSQFKTMKEMALAGLNVRVVVGMELKSFADWTCWVLPNPETEEFKEAVLRSRINEQSIRYVHFERKTYHSELLGRK